MSVVHTLPSRRAKEAPAKLRGDAIKHLTAHHRFADRRFLAPLWPVLEEVEDGDAQVVIGSKQAPTPRDDAVPVVVGITGEGQIKAVLHADQSLHRIGRGGVHADLPIPIHRHEPKGRIDGLVDHREVQPVALSNRLPVVDPGATERIHPQAELRAANGIHVDYMGEIRNVRIEIVVPVRRRGAQRFLERHPFHT